MINYSLKISCFTIHRFNCLLLHVSLKCCCLQLYKNTLLPINIFLFMKLHFCCVIMSVIDFSAAPHQHAEILICIDTIGNITVPEYNEALAKIKKHSKLIITDAGRVVYFRFQVGASPENCKWGFFQPHRRAMGLILLAGCSTAMDVVLMHQKFEDKKKSFSEFIFDSRCFIFGIDNAMLQQNKGEVYQFADVRSWTTSDQDIREFLTSVFYVLESKRIHIAADKSERPPLLTAPFETSQSAMADTDSRGFRKKASGRWKKHLADVSLLAGLLPDALQTYHTAVDLLAACNDQVWLGGALEGLCVVSAIVLYPEAAEVPVPSFEKAEEKQTLDPRNLTKLGTGRTASGTDISKYCIQTADDFIERYKDAVICYTRCRDMAVVEVEACIKATKILCVLNKALKAAEFIQNAVYISLDITHAERITKYDCMANLYKKINFHRKCSFYKRIAAMQCVAPNLEQHDWFGCNLLLQDTLLGCKIDLSGDTGVPDINASRYHGWPQIQLRVLNELVFASRKIGDNQMANRYSVNLLVKLHDHLSEHELREYCSSVENSVNKLAKDHETELLQLQDGTILPPLNLYYLPVVNKVVPQPPEEALQASPLNVEASNQSVFLFSPFSQSSQVEEGNVDFKWSANSPAVVHMQVWNPLRAHCLHVTGLKLICDYADGQVRSQRCHPVTLDIEPNCTADVVLVVEPRTTGTLTVKGYEIEVFGIKSRCFFDKIPWIKCDKFDIVITQELPKLEGDLPHCSPKSKKKKLSFKLHPGEIRSLEIPFHNAGKVPVDVVSITSSVSMATAVTSLSSVAKTRGNAAWLELKCSESEVDLPLLPGKPGKLMVCLKARPENLEDEKMLTSSVPRLCQGHVKVKYSSDDAAKSNWCRVMTVTLDVDMEPCVYLDKLAVTPSASQGYCYVSIRAINMSDKKVRILSETSADVDDADNHHDCEDGHLVAGIVCPDDELTVKFMIGSLVMKTSDACQSTASVNAAHPSDGWFSLLKQLDGVLELQWRIGEKETLRRGVLDVTKCILTRDSFINVTKPTLYWDISINDCDPTDSLCYDAQVGEPYTVVVTMTNVSDSVVPALEVDLEVFQDQCNGYKEFNMDDCVLCLTSQCQSFNQVESDGKCQFECVLLFLLAGEYHVRLHRMTLDDTIDGIHAGLKRTSSNPEMEHNFHNYSPTVVINAKHA